MNSPSRVDRRSFPQQQALDRQQRMARDRRAGTPCTRSDSRRARRRSTIVAVEVPAGIREVIDPLAEVGAPVPPSMPSSSSAIRRGDSIGSDTCAARVRADDEAAPPHVVHHRPT